MENLFVPYQTALLLKEKGFDEPCIGTFDWVDKQTVFIEEVDDYSFERNSIYSAMGSSVVTAPTWDQVQSWFREKHDLHVSVRTLALGYMGCHDNTPNSSTWGTDKRWDSKPLKDYHEALNAAFLKALELI
jgi:hypothetical protein